MHIKTVLGYQQADADLKIYTRGCVDAAILAVKDNMLTIGGVGVAIAVPQVSCSDCCIYINVN